MHKQREASKRLRRKLAWAEQEAAALRCYARQLEAQLRREAELLPGMQAQSVRRFLSGVAYGARLARAAFEQDQGLETLLGELRGAAGRVEDNFAANRTAAARRELVRLAALACYCEERAGELFGLGPGPAFASDPGAGEGQS